MENKTKHAFVRLGEFEIPLIGIEKDQTEEKCLTCGKLFHLIEITLDKDGNPFCKNCLK